MEHQQIDRTYRNLQAFYFLSFFSFGSLFPLLSVYLNEEAAISHTQIGLLIAMIPIVTIVIQPLWGMLSDYTRKPRKLLLVAVLMASILGLCYVFLQGFILLILGIIFIAVFQSAIVPLSDSLSLNFVQTNNKEYGNIRLWGALGFAIAVFIVGKVTDFTLDLRWIFYFFAFALLVCALPLRQFPKRGQDVSVNLRDGMSVLVKNKLFLLFLISNFLMFGPVLANNYYFGTFILSLGGTLTGVGIAFLLAAGSEAPFMRWSQKVINNYGVLSVLLICSFISCSRWFFYSFAPPVELIYITTIVQGVSVGLYIPAALLLVRQLAPKEVQATAVGIYSAVGNGLGNAFFTFVAGILIDLLSVNQMYGFFSAMTGVGFILTWRIKVAIQNKEQVDQEEE